LITEDGGRTVEGYSPFTAEEYKFPSPHKTKPDPEKDATTKEKSKAEQ
jgi:hypothetical protein